MTKRLLPLLFLLVNYHIAGAQQKTILPRLSPQTQLYLHQAPGRVKEIIKGYVYKKDATGHVYISALIKTAPGFNDSQLTGAGVYIGTRAGDIRTVQIPVDQVAAFTRTPGIEYIQLDEPVFPLMDSVRIVTRVDSVQKGINLPQGFSGKNVVMGIIDIGFDYTHPMFFDTLGTTFRVKKVWEQKSSGTPPTGFLYGAEITDSTAMWAAGTDNSTQTHGAHVAGIAAGSGVGSSTDHARFRGVAYGTDVVLVGITPTPAQWQNTGMSDIIDGMNYIYTYAASVGKPAVVNLSWGCSIGPHDGLSLFSKAVDNLTGPGKLFACSAGNTGADNIHLGKTFTAADTVVSTFVFFDAGLSEKKTWVDIWGDSSKTFCAQIGLFTGSVPTNTTGFICLDNAVHNQYLISAAGDTCFINFVTSAAEFNGKPRIFLNIYNKTTSPVVLSVKSGNATVNIWEGFVENSTGYYGSLKKNGVTWAVNGDSLMTISDWSATKSAISVGAYTAKNAYRNISGGNTSYPAAGIGKLIYFSSKGPAADGRILPFITAPGFYVGSGVSSYDASFQPGGSSYGSVITSYAKNGRNYPYAILSGTSMSSPVVSGILALMLEADGTLTPQQAQQTLATTAIQDIHTGTIPASGLISWGHGKVNAYAAIRSVLHLLSVGRVIGNDQSWSIFPNPSNGRFNITCTTNRTEAVTLEVTDITGKTMYRQPWKLLTGNNQTRIDLSSLPKGIYLARMTTQQAQSTIKILIE